MLHDSASFIGNIKLIKTLKKLQAANKNLKIPNNLEFYRSINNVWNINDRWET